MRTSFLHAQFSVPTVRCGIDDRRRRAHRSCIVRIGAQRRSAQMRPGMVADGVCGGGDVRVQIRTRIAPVRAGRREDAPYGREKR